MDHSSRDAGGPARYCPPSLFGDAEKETDLDAYSAWVAEAIEAGRYIGLLVEQDGNTIAGAGITVLDWGPTRGDSCTERGRVVNVFTAPAWRRHGIAKQLVTALIDMAETQGINTFSLAATDDAVDMYAQLGFAPYQSEMLRKAKEGGVI
ncbi:GNAT family N-acetyltransferase [Rugamonas aquatica]|uniref:GNAT family N-acetyltransferase n=1 Tax=Rugamonas aquatica TaxID=2743357 RepID=A0A6A7MVL4_9BURK|nr:GNAT family N-acetyltransferase [Rugamonas aquatica]MQA37081.1 GNAT family N-acetyltransferase [Rugamonas aquatica]